MRQKTWFFKGLLGVSLAFGLLLLLSGCDLLGGGGEEDKTTYTVSYSPGEGSGAAPETKTVKAGEVIILPNQGGMTQPEGKSFGGWKTEAGTYQAGAGFTVNGNTVFTAVWNSGTGGDSLYTGFYNYPNGRVDPAGLLKIKNLANSTALLFNGEVKAENYIGTMPPLGSVQLKMPDDNFYVIVAVDKANYEERQGQASQVSIRPYHSSTYAYSAEITPISTYGGGTWIFNNQTTFWVEVQNTNKTGETYAVVAPKALRFSIPIAFDSPYDYRLVLSKELKYNGKIVTVIEATEQSNNDTAIATEDKKIFTTDINEGNAPTSNVKPAVMVKNSSGKTIRVYHGTQQMTNGGDDLVIASGSSQLVSGFELNDNTKDISFKSSAWTEDLKVPTDIGKNMLANKVYEISISNSGAITVSEVAASTYYN
jgi:hypothetical protein